MAVILVDIPRAGSGVRHWHGVLHRHPVWHVAPRLLVHPRLQLEDDQGDGSGHVLPLLYLRGRLTGIRVRRLRVSHLKKNRKFY